MAIVQIVGSVSVLASLNIQALSFRLNRSKQLLPRRSGRSGQGPSVHAWRPCRPPHEGLRTREPSAFFMTLF